MLTLILQVASMTIVYDLIAAPKSTLFDTVYNWIGDIKMRLWRRRLKKWHAKMDRHFDERVMVHALMDGLQVYYDKRLRPREGIYR